MSYTMGMSYKDNAFKCNLDCSRGILQDLARTFDLAGANSADERSDVCTVLEAIACLQTV